ncbi:GerMN domain-containing protein [Agromyces seonyuensis]|uniref:GerMN domain-containing protein n=1 Tax=Agromyces seonyuensis TaxID=2662446 RepID=A0A6I4P3M6_9MICO|nr:GerMN domain-containing protein [Agromyces seonyuensis]MWC00323.1 hypothetical protein [Agromyces seonyuensis]
MIRRRLARTSLALLAALALLTGCASIPDSGPVQAFDPDTSSGRGNLALLPDGPAPGAEPEAILRGFIDAATSPTGNYQVARQFLTPTFADEWLPQSSATIDLLADREYEEVAADAWRVQASPIAALDGAGVYEAAESSAAIPLDYRFEEVDGEVRISSAPQGVLIDSSNFDLVYASHTLYFYSPGWSDLVPDIRWFADRASVQTSIVRMLLAGPADWLEGGVENAFPADLRLSPDAVPVTGRVAQVELTGTPPTDATTLQRMRLQLTTSLAGVPSISSVRFVVNGETVEPEELDPEPDDVIRIDPRSLVFDGTVFGHLDDGEIQPLAGISDQVVALSPTAASAGPGFDVVAVRAADGTVHAVPRGSPSVVIDERGGLVEPAVDSRGLIWTAQSTHPGSMRWSSIDGERGDLATAWPGSALDGFAISRDGTRLVALVEVGGRSQLFAAAIMLDESGVPVAIGDPIRIGSVEGGGADVVWADSGTVVALSGSSATTLTTIEVGGASAIRSGPEGGVALDAGNSARDTRVLRSSGELDGSSGVGWQVRAEGIRLVATQLQPQ